MPVNWGTALAGIGTGLSKIAQTVPDIYKTQAQTELLGKQAREKDWGFAKDQEAYNARKQHFGDMAGLYANIDSTRADNINTAYMGANKIAILERAGLLKPGTTQNAVQAVNDAYQQINPSVSQDASVTPPISQVGKNGYQEAPKPTQPQNEVAQFNEIMGQLGMLDAGWNGKQIYSNPNKYSVATNRYSGEGVIADPTSHASAVEYDQTRADEKRTKSAKNIHDANRPYNTYRGSSGGRRGRGRHPKGGSSGGGNSGGGITDHEWNVAQAKLSQLGMPATEENIYGIVSDMRKQKRRK